MQDAATTRRGSAAIPQMPHPEHELDPNTLMASQRTALSLERTTMSADRTQMSVMRTSLSLIGFGFTIHKFFQELARSTQHAAALEPPARNFAAGLVILGVALLVASLFNNYRVMKSLRARRQMLFEHGLLRHPPTYSTSANMVISILVLLGGLLVMIGILLRAGPLR